MLDLLFLHKIGRWKYFLLEAGLSRYRKCSGVSDTGTVAIDLIPKPMRLMAYIKQRAEGHERVEGRGSWAGGGTWVMSGWRDVDHERVEGHEAREEASTERQWGAALKASLRAQYGGGG